MIPEATTRDYQQLPMSLLYKMTCSVGWKVLEQKNGKKVYYSPTLANKELCRRAQKIRSRWLGNEEETE